MGPKVDYVCFKIIDIKEISPKAVWVNRDLISEPSLWNTESFIFFCFLAASYMREVKKSILLHNCLVLKGHLGRRGENKVNGVKTAVNKN